MAVELVILHSDYVSEDCAMTLEKGVDRPKPAPESTHNAWSGIAAAAYEPGTSRAATGADSGVQTAGFRPHPGYCNPALPSMSYGDWLKSQGLDPHKFDPKGGPDQIPPDFDFSQPNKPYENPNRPKGPVTVPCPPGEAVA
jgi:hypothetical protein